MPADPTDTAPSVLAFWFQQLQPRQWFAKDPAVDALLGQRFRPLCEAAIQGRLGAWEAMPAEALALVLLLDQLPRQIWRHSAKAFAGDARALALSLKALELGWVADEPERPRRQFWLMPLMHAEDLAIQDLSLPLFERHTDPRTALFARRHREVIARFGRFPHRNSALGRPSTGDELAFLQTPGSGF